MIWFILWALSLVIAFYAGIFFGIHDCKRRFKLPKGAQGVDDNGCIYP